MRIMHAKGSYHLTIMGTTEELQTIVTIFNNVDVISNTNVSIIPLKFRLTWKNFIEQIRSLVM